MDIYQLQVFVSVYQHRSFTKASAELNLTQPTVSLHIKRLEEDLGVTLFERTGRKTIPTREAEMLHTRAEEIIKKLSAIKNDLQGGDDSAHGLITIGTTATPGAYVIPHVAAEFRKHHPKAIFQVIVKESAAIFDMIEDRLLLIGVVDDNRERPDIKLLHTIEDEMVLIAAPGFLKRKTLTPLGLLGIPIIMREDESDSKRSMEKQHFLHKVSMKALNVVATVGSSDALRESVKSGLGAAILSRFAVKDDLKAGLVEEIRIVGVKMKRNFYVIAHATRTMPKDYELFVEFMKEYLS